MKGIRILPPTQTSTLKKEVRALKAAEKKDIPLADIVATMAKQSGNNNQVEAIQKALNTITCVMDITKHKTPIHDAVQELRANQQTPAKIQK
uniref:Uncharacterized protein n=1 Tax=Pectobacterium carotovorum TaxID=554 RepID=A0A0K0MQ42_PECCA|nr:hypothetical protein [Pectobacterium carotovorum]AKG47557.1 hypothetical protein pA_00117 [Pectobacterium carotovorum]